MIVSPKTEISIYLFILIFPGYLLISGLLQGFGIVPSEGIAKHIVSVVGGAAMYFIVDRVSDRLVRKLEEPEKEYEYDHDLAQ